MPEKTSLQGVYVFRGVEYVLSMQVKGDSLLTVTVEDRLTANQWKGSFDSAYIEDMTHKTGNYKQFHVFINMLESAITQTSDAVTMDLLTFNDLEVLRKRKAGAASQHIPGANSSSLTQKRYLILTYAVEFDKIHYPLPLPYAGKPDPEVLQEMIRSLQLEIKALKSQESKDYRWREFEKLKSDYDVAVQEKESVEREYLALRKELKNTSAKTAVKELRILKGVVKNLEDELVKEKAKHQRAAAKRRSEFQDLQDEVQELRVSERTLRVRVKSLTNELAVYKRKAISSEHSRNSSRPSSRPSSRHSRAVVDRPSPNLYSRERSLSRERGRSLSAERPRSADRRSSSRYTNPNSRLSSPLDRRSSPYDRRSSYNSQANSRSSFGRTPSPGHGLRPSPAGTRKPRFDPTAYVAEKKRQQVHKAKSSPVLYNRNKPSPGSDRGRSANRRPANGYNDIGRGRSTNRVPSRRVRTSSVDSLGSVSSSRRRKNSYSDGNMSDGSQRGSRNGSMEWHSADAGWTSDSPSNKYYGKSTPNTSTPNVRGYSSRLQLPVEREGHSLNHSADIDDIDARLQRIQDMMKGGI